MHRIKKSLVLFCIPLLLSCTTGPDSPQLAEGGHHKQTSARPVENTFPETFEQGNKRAYAAGDVQLATGLWQLDNALIGKTDGDAKDGDASLRLAAGGSATMRFDIHSPVKAIKFRYACYSKDARSEISTWYSTDGGAHWLQVDAHLIVSSTSLTTTISELKAATSIRFSIHNDGGGRINVDDFDVLPTNGSVIKGDSDSTGNTTGNTATRDDNMALGNPSNATDERSNKHNYLLVHPQYTLSYNNEKGMANWVSWHLSMAWRGTATRCNCFFSDAALPEDFFHATTSNYIATGFDRGHLCPSDDRTASAEDNAATFLMANISPQAPFLNQQPWEKLEEYARTLSAQGKELYIIAGGYGQGGAGSKGNTSNTIAGGSINVPSHFWKILIVLPVGNSDLSRITKETRIIAVDMPNTQSVNEHGWDYYRTSVKNIEAATGYNFLSKLPKELSDALKNKVDANKIKE